MAALAVGLVFSLPAVWIWRWPARWWARIERHEDRYGTVWYQPFAALRTVPTLLGSIWFGVFAWATLLDRITPHVFDRLPLPLGFALLSWWFIVPGSVYVTGHPALLVPPGARRRQLAAAEGALQDTAQRRLEDLVETGLATGELRLQGNRSFAAVALLGSLLLLGASLAFASSLGARGWWGPVLFGMGVIVFGAQLIPGMMYLELTPHGFASRQLLKTFRYQWRDASGLAQQWDGPTFARRQIVGFRYAPTITLPDSASVPRFMKGNRLPGALGALGIPGRVTGNYGMTAEELASLMNRWRDRFAGGESGRPR